MPRVAVNSALLVAVLLLVLTGTAELFAGSAVLGWLYVLHRGAAVALLPLLAWKVPIAAGSLRRRGLALSVGPGLLLAAVVLGLALTGTMWIGGVGRTLEAGGNSLLALHLYLYYALALPLGWHLCLRWRRPRPAAFRQRRALLRLAATGGLGLAAATAFAVAGPWLRRVPATRRFSGSFAAGSGSGNDFPVTAFLNDDPGPLDPAAWRLVVGGRVARPLTLGYANIALAPDRLVASVDCTGGWFAEREWRGMLVGRLLERAGAEDGAALVLFHSSTGYASALPLDEARGAMLATHVGGVPLAHGHGFPLRLVAPERRGFQWVKWVTRLEVV